MRVKAIISKLVQVFLHFIPKSKRVWIFGAWSGELYGDNTKYLFEYLHTISTKNKLVWITKRDDVVKAVRDKGYLAYKRNTLRGVWNIARGKIAFCSEGVYDISLLIGKKTKIIQLWHGMGAKALNWKLSEKTANDLRLARSSWYWTSTSSLYTDINSYLLGVPKERFTITGYPRNDALVEAPYNQNMEELRRKYDGCKFIVYMPTHRNFGAEGNKHINIDELKRVDKLLNEKNIVMVYKPHIHELKNFVKYENEFSNIILAKDQSVWGDVYSYLNYFDLLISDYSSVLTDFMCTGKPIVYFPYDIDDYINGDAGVNDFFWEIPGGPMGYTWDEVLKYTEELLENDTWKEERERCRKIYHVFNDGKNSERVYQMVNDILKNNK